MLTHDLLEVRLIMLYRCLNTYGHVVDDSVSEHRGGPGFFHGKRDWVVHQRHYERAKAYKVELSNPFDRSLSCCYLRQRPQSMTCSVKLTECCCYSSRFTALNLCLSWYPLTSFIDHHPQLALQHISIHIASLMDLPVSYWTISLFHWIKPSYYRSVWFPKRFETWSYELPANRSICMGWTVDMTGFHTIALSTSLSKDIKPPVHQLSDPI